MHIILYECRQQKMTKCFP